LAMEMLSGLAVRQAFPNQMDFNDLGRDLTQMSAEGKTPEK